jgi:hypothetical protein
MNGNGRQRFAGIADSPRESMLRVAAPNSKALSTILLRGLYDEGGNFVGPPESVREITG